jgi:hypothetical protein
MGRIHLGGRLSLRLKFSKCITGTVKRENLAHTYFSANARMETLAQINISAFCQKHVFKPKGEHL